MFYQILDELNCKTCNCKLDEPKILPCGTTICTKCVDLIEVKDSKFKCVSCSNEHIYPADGFITNQALVNLLSLKHSAKNNTEDENSQNESLNLFNLNLN